MVAVSVLWVQYFVKNDGKNKFADCSTGMLQEIDLFVQNNDW
jgi:hypothetical protein